MLPDLTTSRNLVRKRIIRRNVNYPLMMSFYVLSTLAGLAMFPTLVAIFMGVFSPWLLAVPMSMMLASVTMCTHYWFKMIDHMKTSTRDCKFVNKMLKEEFW
jgi:fatty acid desaturase